jgi:hypothetical protein
LQDAVTALEFYAFVFVLVFGQLGHRPLPSICQMPR